MVTGTATYSMALPLVARAPQYRTGIDVSKHQGKMDWGKAAGAGVQFAAVRCTVGDYYVDPEFDRNWTQAREAGIPVTAYHVVAPADGGRRITGERQMDYFYDALSKVPDYGTFPYVLDCELAKGEDARWITNCIEDCISRFDILPIIYTRASWWDVFVLESTKWQECPLWVANYTTAPQPYMPRDWSTWAIWQWSADGNGMGRKYGAESHSIDLNRWNPEVPFLFEDDNNGGGLPPIPPSNDNMTVQMQALFGDDVFVGEAVLERE